MIDLQGVKHHPIIEDIVSLLCNKTQNNDRKFFRVESAFFLAKIASNMRATLVTQDRGDIPVNLYSLILANSGFGKGQSICIWEQELLNLFQTKFVEDTMPIIADEYMLNLASAKALKNNTTEEEELSKIKNDYNRAGVYYFTFDSGTTPAIKQFRNKLLIGGCGAISLQIDEIGSNLIGSTDILNTFLELYDQGIVKQKLTKNTAENARTEEINGKTPTNMLLFGTPIKLLDGSKTEDEFYSFLETGYARRCIFALGNPEKKSFHTMTPTEVFQQLANPSNTNTITKYSSYFESLADVRLFDWKIKVPEPVAIKLIEYRINCEKEAEKLSDYDEIKKAELSHRYFKALKLAGVYAFIDKDLEVSMENLLSAILLIEESGKAFQGILSREKPYVKLAKYITSMPEKEFTHADLCDALPFYKQSDKTRKELMSLAIAWGYKQHILIKKSVIDDIEFFKGETLQETNLDEMIISYSTHFAYNFFAEKVPFEKLHILTQQKDYHWCNHHFLDQHRSEENVIAGCNMIVLDCDGTVSLNTARELLKEVKYLIYTTKRHTEQENRFRVIIPTNYILKIDNKQDYKEFMNSILSWIPFESDPASNQRSHKWMTYDGGTYFYNLEAPLFDVIPFIPKTTKHEQYKKELAKIENLSNLERWFLTKMNTEGGRNNYLIQYALVLKDMGEPEEKIKTKVLRLNEKLSIPLQESEIKSTIFVTIHKKFNN